MKRPTQAIGTARGSMEWKKMADIIRFMIFANWLAMSKLDPWKSL
jgi:hypothetical protein